MDVSIESPALAERQAAIQYVRNRYEIGDLSFEAFRRALDALVLARPVDECQVILDELPAPATALVVALERRTPSAPGAKHGPRHKFIIAVLGQARKLRRRWSLAPKSWHGRPT